MLVVFSGCASRHATTERNQRGLIAADSPVEDHSVIGTLNNHPISVGELDEAIRAKLHDVENAAAQRRLHLMWVGFEEAVAQSLLQQEAKRRHVSVTAMLQDQVDKRLREPTEADITAAYQADPDLVARVPLQQATDIIKAQLIAEQRQQLRDAFVDTLRNNATVHYDFPIPELPRYRMDTANSPSRGPADAAITLITFTDYQCTYCKRANTTIEALRLRYPEQIRVISQDFPLPQHPQALLAAEAAFCAREQNRFWHYHDRLFANPEDLSREALVGHATDLKLDMAAFESCLDGSRAKDAVEASVTMAERYGVSGTPAIFLNGIKLIGVLPLPVLQALIEHELAQAASDEAG